VDVAQEQLVRKKLRTALVIPVILMLVLGGVLIALSVQLRSVADRAQHSQRIVSVAHRLQKEVLDKETGVRGYLLTGDIAFLEPYDRANPIKLFDELAELVSDNPVQVRQIQDSRIAYETWIVTAERRHVLLRNDDIASQSALQARKRQMDRFRASIHEFLENEQILLLERSANNSAVTRRSDSIVLFLCVSLAVVLVMVTRKQMEQIATILRANLEKEARARHAVEAEARVRSGALKIAEAVRGELSSAEIAQRAIAALVAATQAEVGALYLKRPDGILKLSASHALHKDAPTAVNLGEGLLGEAARGTAVRVMDLPRGYLRLESASGGTDLETSILLPFDNLGNVEGIGEFGFTKPVNEETRLLAERSGNIVGAALAASISREETRHLLDESQQQREELQTQQEELRTINEELQARTDAERDYRAQLEERGRQLEQANTGLQSNRDALERLSHSLEDKATELERASKYKSEFMANMSHELRTPLNSALILSRLLMENEGGNLTSEQVKFAKTIHAAGNDLLSLINDILDLARIEAGKLEIQPIETTLERALEPVLSMFEPIALEKGVALQAEFASIAVFTDVQKLQQIVKNLLSNAFKFTASGKIVLRVAPAGDDYEVACIDTGIGIDAKKTEVIFEAFRQADGTTNRKYGGTGLGLSISRELARLLHGTISVTSELGKGSTFVLRAKRRIAEQAPSERQLVEEPSAAEVRTEDSPASVGASLEDDRLRLAAAQPILLIVEDDAVFARLLMTEARMLGFQVLLAQTAAEAKSLVEQRSPTAMVLDIQLPDHSGLTVLEHVRGAAETHAMPVLVLSGTDTAGTALRLGATAFMRKPLERTALIPMLESLKTLHAQPQRQVLLIEPDAAQRARVEAAFRGNAATLVSVSSLDEAKHKLATQRFDCIVTDVAGGGSEDDVLSALHVEGGAPLPPIVVHTAKSLSPDEELRLRAHVATVVLKGDRSTERLLDEVGLFLRSVQPPRAPAPVLRSRQEVFAGRVVLVAEDDVRNVFVLTSLLEPKGFKVMIARNGVQALRELERIPKVDVVLMDLMMPEMDGLTAIREIRKQERLKSLPIIALTAKAMPDDQRTCIEAGANDYIAKPFDPEILLSLLRVWLA
jgi:signal transduction histidine kinase/CheY-like chemotaxis protein/CHASE3 domain sensor protein